MNVLIKGLKMPKKGLVEIIISPDGKAYVLARPLIDTEHAEVSEIYDTTELPDHGDLVVFITPKGKKVEYSKVKHGKWGKISDRNYKCSCCNAWWSVDRDSVMKDFNYCPNCGAKMDGGKDDPER